MTASRYATTLFFAAAAYSIGLGPQPASAAQRCVAVMQVVGVPAQVAAETDEGTEDANGDGQIWTDMGGGRMAGFVGCSDVPGAKHGDTYEQQYGSGSTRKTGNNRRSADSGDYLLQLSSGRRSSTSGSSGSSSSSSGGSRSGGSRSNSTTYDDSGSPSVAGKKRPPVAQPQ